MSVEAVNHISAIHNNKSINNTESNNGNQFDMSIISNHETNYNNTNNKNINRNNKQKIKFTVILKKLTICSTPTLLAFILLQCCLGGWDGAIKPVNAGVTNNSGTGARKTIAAAESERCVVVLGNSEVFKEVGAVWVSSQDPCAVHACETDGGGIAHETISTVDCQQFYCDVDSELRPQEGICCGECVRTKCRFNDTAYEVGQTWHNINDCTLLECTQLPGGQPMINAYQKSCPRLPPDCAPEETYVQDCCEYCATTDNVSAASSPAPRSGLSEKVDIWTEEFYRNHPCVRECQANTAPMTCQYKFIVEWYETLSKACYACPQNATDCARPHCIVTDGIPRSVTVVNRMMPGPSIEVCENDLIVVDVSNHLLGESTTIHWHGMHQKNTPYMDGVPHISQCPISPHSSFRYAFKADNSGTHFWHSHTGMQRGDGVFGAFIVRRPRVMDPHGHLYDFDMPEHKMIVQDWVHVPGISMFASHHHSRGDNKPLNLLINGRGRYYKAIWELEKKARSGNETSAVIPETQDKPAAKVTESTVPPSTVLPGNFESDIDLLYPQNNPERISMRLKQSNEISSRLARVAMPNNDATKTVQLNPENQEVNTDESTLQPSNLEETTLPTRVTTGEPDIELASSMFDSTRAHVAIEGIGSSHTRSKRSAEDFEIPLHNIPLQVYNVRHGFRYRFRIINAEFLNCPIAISIDNHSLNAINSDGYDFEAVEVGSIVTYAGERFDFVVHANQSVGNYWIRLKGLMDCSELFTSAFQVAILHYEGAPNEEPNSQVGYHHKAEGIELNVMNRGPGHVYSLTIAELTSLQSYDSVSGVDRDALKPVADYKFFVYYDFYGKDNPSFHHGDYYGFNANLSNSNRVYTPQLNHISLKFPSVALLPARNDVDDSMFCNDTSLAAQGINCREEFCKCHHVLQVPLNAIVELIIVDEGLTYDANHPFHLHGNAFRVVGLERLGANVTIEMIKQLDSYNLLKRNLVRPPVKDTVTVPDGGYTIIRFEASNPGFWLFHCHIEFHAEIGMALIIKVGNNDEMLPVPKNFPTCHDYMPDAHNSENNGQDGQQQRPTTTPAAEAERSAAGRWITTNLLFTLGLCILSCCIHL